MQASQLPTFGDQTHPRASDKLDFDIPYFVGPSTADFLTGTVDMDMNFDWVGVHSSKDVSVIQACTRSNMCCRVYGTAISSQTR
jgi:hypothetical protein